MGGGYCYAFLCQLEAKVTARYASWVDEGTLSSQAPPTDDFGTGVHANALEPTHLIIIATAAVTAKHIHATTHINLLFLLFFLLGFRSFGLLGSLVTI